MVYMGSKSKYTSKIVPILQRIIDTNGITTYVEPFVGGANVIDKIKCQNKFGFDKNQTLIALLSYGQIAPQEIPSEGSREWWDEAKTIYRATKGDFSKEDSPMPLWKIGAIQFLGSFSNGGFSRGYAKNVPGRNFYNEAYRNFMKQTENPLYQDIHFISIEDYSKIPETNHDLIYCDPPYQGTKPYGYTFEVGFDYKIYWDWVRERSKNNFVVCSEQTFPDDFYIIWEQEVKRTCGKDNTFKATEKLGIWKEGLLNV